MGLPAEKLTRRRGVHPPNRIVITGDKSSKAKPKKSAQKQLKANSAEQKKKQAMAAKQTASKRN